MIRESHWNIDLYVVCTLCMYRLEGEGFLSGLCKLYRGFKVYISAERGLRV